MPEINDREGGGVGSPLTFNKIWKGNASNVAEEASLPAGTGDVIAPATNTANKVPQWDGTNSKTLKDGLAVGTAAYNLLQLNGDAKNPAVDGSLLTNVEIAAATDTVAGKVELATIAECNTGTDTERAVTPDALAGSKHGTKYMVFEVFPDTTALATGDGKKKMLVPADLAGYNIVSVEASLSGAKSTSGTPTIQIARGRQPDATTIHSFEDVLSTRLTIDVNEWYSGNATTAAVIDTTKDDILAGDIIRIDVDEAGTGAQGLFVVIGFRLP